MVLFVDCATRYIIICLDITDDISPGCNPNMYLKMPFVAVEVKVKPHTILIIFVAVLYIKDFCVNYNTHYSTVTRML